MEFFMKNIVKIVKYVVQMANLSVPSPGKWILDIFGKNIFDIFSTFFC